MRIVVPALVGSTLVAGGVAAFIATRPSDHELLREAYEDRYGTKMVADAIELQREDARAGTPRSFMDCLQTIQLEPLHEDRIDPEFLDPWATMPPKDRPSKAIQKTIAATTASNVIL